VADEPYQDEEIVVNGKRRARPTIQDFIFKHLNPSYSVGADSNHKMTGFNIQQFNATVSKYGVLQTNRFLVLFDLPKTFPSIGQTRSGTVPLDNKLTTNGLDYNRELTLYCESASLPSIMFDTSYVRRYGYGPTERKPYNPVFADMNFQFLGDAHGVILRVFHNWMASIINFNGSRGLRTPSGDLMPYEIEYKDNYKADIRIAVYNDHDDEIIIYTLHDAYPVMLGEIAMGWNDMDNLMRIPVSFTYRDWSSNSLKDPSLADYSFSRESTFQKTIKTLTGLATAANIRKPQSISDVINIVNTAAIVVNNI
jgi:hypothetical protein